jgi:predicted transcriptional regulator
MFNTRKPRKALSELEHAVMEFLWSSGPATAERVREALAPQRRLKDSTVRTVLRRLEQKGYAEHRENGRTYVYRAVEGPRSHAVQVVRQIIDRFCGGSVEQLLVGLVDGEVIDRRELRKLAARIARRRAGKGG